MNVFTCKLSYLCVELEYESSRGAQAAGAAARWASDDSQTCRSTRKAPINMTISVSSFLTNRSKSIFPTCEFMTDFKTWTLPRITDVWNTWLQLEVGTFLTEFLQFSRNLKIHISITFQCFKIMALYFT